MKFDDWMQLRNLSHSSIKKYAGAVNGALSDWAMRASLLDGPLTSITDVSQLDELTNQIRKLPVFIERNKTGNSMYSAALAQLRAYTAEGYDVGFESDIEDILNDASVGETERLNLLKARLGQGRFRQRLIGYWKYCAVTRYSDPNFLIASHIKPWRAASNTERLCQFNGLLLVPNLDAAFDKGFITFDTSGLIAISPQFSEPEKLGIFDGMHVNLTASHQPYMDFHRAEVFRDA